MRSSIAKVTGVAVFTGVALIGAAGTASAHHHCPAPHGALAVGGDAFALSGDEKKDNDNWGDERGEDEGGANALAVGGDAIAIGDDASALAVGGDAVAIGKDHDEDEDCD